MLEYMSDIKDVIKLIFICVGFVYVNLLNKYSITKGAKWLFNIRTNQRSIEN